MKGIFIRRKLFGVVLLVLWTSCLMAQSQHPPIGQLRDYIRTEMLRWQVPGLAVAVVKDGQVLMNEGFGVRNNTNGTPVDDQTIFANCSTTKAMTAIAMAMLVDEGKVQWQDCVSEHLPDFLLSDPYVTREMRVQDLFTHNIGLGNADFLWAGSDLKPSDILYQMRYAPLAYSLRGGYTYQNIMYLAAGEIIARRSGLSWEDFLSQRIFQPLGMRNTYPTLQRSLVNVNRSTPHHRIGGKIGPIQDSSADQIGAAGSVWSCSKDMTLWIRCLLDSTKYGAGRLISPGSYAKLFEPLALIPRAQFYPTARLTQPHWTTYGLGWFQHDYHGRMVQFHTGSLAGTVAILGLLPEEKLGVFVFGNLDHAEIRHAIMYKTFDVFMGRSQSRNWSEEFHQLYQNLEQQSKNQREKILSSRRTDTKPTFPLTAYSGKFKHKFYGEIEVTAEPNRLMARFSSTLVMPLDHWQFDQFTGQFTLYPWEPAEILNFIPNQTGLVQQLQYNGIIFERG